MTQVNCAINHLEDLISNSDVYELLAFNELFNGSFGTNWQSSLLKKSNYKNSLHKFPFVWACIWIYESILLNAPPAIKSNIFTMHKENECPLVRNNI